MSNLLSSTPDQHNQGLKRLLPHFKRSFWTLALVSMAINLLMIVPAIYMLQIYDRVITSNSGITLLMLTLILILLLGTMGLLEWVRSRMLIINSTKLDCLVNTEIFKGSFHNALPHGRSVDGNGLEDLAGVRRYLTSNALFAFFDAPWIPVYVAVMFAFHHWYGWVAVFAIIVLALSMLANEKLSSHLLRKANEQSQQEQRQMTTQYRNADAVYAMGMLGNLERRWRHWHNDTLYWQAKASAVSSMLSTFTKNFRLTIQSLILGLGAWLVIQEQMSSGTMIAGSILLGRALAPLDQLIGTWRGFVTARQQFQRLNDLLQHNSGQAEPMPLPAPQGHIHVENVSVALPKSERQLLKNINFSVNAGELVAIVGGSASGKTTLIRTLLGLWPVACGHVRLDSADITHWNRDALGQYIGYLPQDIELFDGSVKDNIARFGEVDADAVIRAAQQAGVHEMILALPEGYDTQITSRSGILSGGQRQRLALARALYGEPTLIILDEPNANLDEAGDLALTDCLKNLKKAGKTVFIASHRPNTFALADKLLVMANGEIKDFGPAQLLLNKYRTPTAVKPAKAKVYPSPHEMQLKSSWSTQPSKRHPATTADASNPPENQNTSVNS